MKFELGQVVATPGAVRALEVARVSALELIERHQSGDWGIVNEEDAAANELDLLRGGRLLSVYRLWDQTRIYVITEWDRSCTTILLPEEY